MVSAVLIAGAVLRRYFALQPLTYHYDIYFFREWGDAIVLFGSKNVYSSGMFLDYPPGYMYVLWLSTLVKNFVGLSHTGRGYTFVIKSPAMAADILSAIIIYYIACKKLDEKTAVFLSRAYTFCPAIIYNSSIWGQIDSWYTLFILLSILFVTENKVVLASVSYAIALITKPQALLFGPVLLFWVISKKDIKVFLKAVVTGLGCIWLMALPFSQTISPFWLIDLYINTFGGYKYFTVNGYNIYMMAGLNFAELGDSVAAAMINPAVIFICFIFCAWSYFRFKNPARNFSTAVVLISVFFSFCTMMHERYLHPAIILAVMAYIYCKNKGWLAVALGFSAANYLNVAGSMHRNILLVDIPVHYSNFTSILTVATTVLALCLACAPQTYNADK